MVRIHPRAFGNYNLSLASYFFIPKIFKTMKKNKTKALVLLSGGLDSRLAVKLMQEQNIKVIAVYFNLPFVPARNMKETINFAKSTGIPLKIINCTRGKLFQAFISIVKKPRYGYGRAMNPCIDCRIFMLKEAKQLLAKLKTDFIVTGEVLNERPFSQTKRALMLIEKEVDLEGKILRPLSAKLLKETEAEEKNLIDRNELLDISGRRRIKQLELAKHFKISYPMPAGGCLLCEKEFAKKLSDLFRYKKKFTFKDIELLKIGRHFRFKKAKIIVGRNEEENKELRKLARKNELIFEAVCPSPLTLLQNSKSKEAIIKAAQLTAYYSDAKKENKKNIEVHYGKKRLDKSLIVSIPDQKEIKNLKI